MEKVNIDPIVAKIQILPKFKAIYDKAVLSGRRIMGSPESTGMIQQQLDKQGEFSDNLAEGVVVLVYQLWNASRKTLPPQIMGPLTFQLTLEAFDFVQKSNDDRATKEALGNAVDKALSMLLKGFNVDPANIEQFIKQNRGAMKAADAGPEAAPAAPAGGMITQGGAQ